MCVESCFCRLRFHFLLRSMFQLFGSEPGGGRGHHTMVQTFNPLFFCFFECTQSEIYSPSVWVCSLLRHLLCVGMFPLATANTGLFFLHSNVAAFEYFPFDTVVWIICFEFPCVSWRSFHGSAYNDFSFALCTSTFNWQIRDSILSFICLSASVNSTEVGWIFFH